MLMENICPKCGEPKTADSCPKCGLVFARYRPAAFEAVPPGLAELWDHVERHWDEAAAHAAFVERAFFLEQSGFAAHRYRTKGDDPTARAQTARIVSRMEQALLASKTEPLPPRRSSRTALLALLFIAAATAAGLFAIQMYR